MKKIYSIAMIAALLLIVHIGCPVCEAQELHVSAESAIVMETTARRVLYSKNADTRMSMASTTKIMTALLAVESGQMDQTITITAEMLKTEGSSIYLQAGDELTLRSLVLGLMLESGNDAALAIAIALDGSEEVFAQRMNRRAKELGMTDTNFVTASGLDDELHYTTARDLAMLACAAMDNPTFEGIACQRTATVEIFGKTPRRRIFTNHNRLLREMDGCIGVKTGFTKKSGRCLVTCCQREGVRLVAVTLRAPDDWNDHKRMMNSGFSLLEQVSLDGGTLHIAVPVVGGSTEITQLTDPLPMQAVVPIGRKNDIIMKIETEPFLYAPIQPQQVAGQVTFWLDGQKIGESALLTDESIPYVPRKLTGWQKFCGILRKWFGIGEE